MQSNKSETTSTRTCFNIFFWKRDMNQELKGCFLFFTKMAEAEASFDENMLETEQHFPNNFKDKN